MKKLLFIILFLLSAQFLFCQVLKGKWVIPTIESDVHKTFELSFMSDGSIISDELPISLPGVEPFCEISSGGYLSNFELQFYFLGIFFCYGNQPPFQWNFMGSQTVSDFDPEFQIINKPGSYNRYYAFYTGSDYDADEINKKFCFTEVYFENNDWHLSGHNLIFSPYTGLTSFGITNENEGNRFLYAATPFNNSYPASLKKWTINDQGIVSNSMEVLLDSDDPDLEPDDFSAYNLEVKTRPNEEDIIAWISNASNEKIFIFRDGVAYAFNLHEGRIGGIEFSDYNPDYLYVSCHTDGLIAINYTSGQVVQQLDTSDYGHTYLQKAPDGHIYGVSNSGHFLGRINQTTGEFEPDVFEMPSQNDGNIVSTFRVFGEQKFFILPEDSREYIPLTVEIEPTHVSCPGLVNGSAEAIVTGGQPDFTYQWYSWNDNVNDFILMPGYIEPIAENLSVGWYKCCVTDANEEIVCSQEIEITVNPLLFSHPGQFWVINATPAEPVTANYEFELGIMVTNNSTLTLNNCYFQFGKDAKVIVEQGSKLILNNTVFTNLEACGNMWQGVEVWGNRNASQHTTGAQGKLILINGAVIENAVTAVELWKPGEDNMTGGIIEAENSLFLNNARSIHAINYRNFNPSFPNNEVDYIGSFTNCSFFISNQIGQEYLGDKTFYKHVDLDRVRGIKFYGCSFSLDHTASNVSQWNLGIAAYNAGFNVLPTCSTHVVPCPLIDSCRFNGFNWAIGVWTPAQLVDPPVLIQNAHFKDNSTGVYINNQNYAVVLENFFEAGYSGQYHGNCDFADGVGIDIQQSNGFVVENNKLRKNSAAIPGHYAGIRVSNCPSAHDIIYKNELIGLSFGNYAEGINRSEEGNDATGVEYRCNFNFDNAIDFAVKNYDEDHRGMIHGDQGFERPDTACGNYFSASASCHIWNDGYQEIDWIYNQNNFLETPKILWQHPPYTFIDPEPVDDMNECPDHHGGGIHLVLTQQQRQAKEIEFAQNLTDYNSVLTLYESLIDGGNTEAELSGIQSAEPDELWTLRSHLLGLSPHLSQEVLRAVSDRTDVFPADVLLDILSSNPDELDKDTLLSYMEQKEDPLPDYMIDILWQVSDEITYKTLLQEDMAYYQSGKTLAAQDIIRSILNDTVFYVDDYRAWLDNLGGMEADKQIIASYLYENDTTSALALLQLIPGLYDLEGQALDDFIDYKSLVEMQIAWNTAGKTLLELDSLDISGLEAYAINGASTAGNMARNILEYANVQHYCNCLQSTDSAFYKSSPKYLDLTPIRSNGLFVSVEPNPANTWVAFNYKLPDENSTGLLSISDASGKLLTQISIAGKAGQEVVNTEIFDPGLYYYTVTVSGLTKSGKFIIQ